jgi:hypothetical protein
MEWQKHTKRAITIGHFPQNRTEYSSKPCSQTHGQGELGFLKHSSDHGQATQGYWEYSPEPTVVNPLRPMVPHFLSHMLWAKGDPLLSSNGNFNFGEPPKVSGSIFIFIFFGFGVMSQSKCHIINNNNNLNLGCTPHLMSKYPRTIWVPLCHVICGCFFFSFF